MTNFNFNSKETYLAARAQWKAEYLDISQQIRDARKAYVEAARAFSKVGPYRWNAGMDINKPWHAAWLKLDEATMHRASLVRQANDLIHTLYQMKAEAAAQWEAARALA